MYVCKCTFVWYFLFAEKENCITTFISVYKHFPFIFFWAKSCQHFTNAVGNCKGLKASRTSQSQC